ncbi:hypothetical protein B4135_1292 [Caldibacillus debilis]|uniref:Uncharacterized protein n=1 Tax=Caldibacillus debilis TaxID=301148 RepID=A0A150ME14_9BACI|nr:hypothetical protein B4135_1292 [Caldibacillus debilis]
MCAGGRKNPGFSRPTAPCAFRFHGRRPSKDTCQAGFLWMGDFADGQKIRRGRRPERLCKAPAERGRLQR